MSFCEKPSGYVFLPARFVRIAAKEYIKASLRQNIAIAWSAAEKRMKRQEKKPKVLRLFLQKSFKDFFYDECRNNPFGVNEIRWTGGKVRKECRSLIHSSRLIDDDECMYVSADLMSLLSRYYPTPSVKL